jgi:hypothetical protein
MQKTGLALGRRFDLERKNIEMQFDNRMDALIREKKARIEELNSRRVKAMHLFETNLPTPEELG